MSDTMYGEYRCDDCGRSFFAKNAGLSGLIICTPCLRHRTDLCRWWRMETLHTHTCAHPAAHEGHHQCACGTTYDEHTHQDTYPPLSDEIEETA